MTVKSANSVERKMYDILAETRNALGYNEYRALAKKAGISDKTFRRYRNRMLQKQMIAKIEANARGEKVLHMTPDWLRAEQGAKSYYESHLRLVYEKMALLETKLDNLSVWDGTEAMSSLLFMALALKARLYVFGYVRRSQLLESVAAKTDRVIYRILSIVIPQHKPTDAANLLDTLVVAGFFDMSNRIDEILAGMSKHNGKRHGRKTTGRYKAGKKQGNN